MCSCLTLSLLVAAVPVLAQNPAADGFDVEASDARAIELADATMEAMGGRQAWDQTRFLHWNFFGFRTHLWDKWTGDLRFQQQKRTVLMNVNSRQGRVFEDGVEVTDEEARAKALQATYEAWINDMYWLAMPYKLKDSGVTLTYVGEQPMEDGRMADVVQLTFEGVGVTPQNKYHVSIAKETGLVEQWAFFADAGDPEPRFKTPWAKWTRHGGVLLSGDRGERQISEIRVYEDVPSSVFESAEPPDWSALEEVR
ncbi:MAG: hypothetical protein DWQ36_09450 [Acidobacteria bacterium]|nr:MAG: hypothetical protein DWQ30_04925 [Acidobacteriota bacterium]REK08599.1 MAG: hypothetical protein DWQ36_09450 [Acidobacteriota bacterium]